MKSNPTRKVCSLILVLFILFSFSGTALAAESDMEVVGEIEGQEVQPELVEEDALAPMDAFLPRPMNLYAKMSPTEKNAVEFGWKSGGSDYIVVVRATDLGGPWVDLTGLAQSDFGEDSVYLDKDVTPGTTYYYELCYYTFEGERQYTDPVAITVPIDNSPAAPKTPTGLGIKIFDHVGTDEIRVYWDNTYTDIDWENYSFGYEVYRATSANGVYTLIADYSYDEDYVYDGEGEYHIDKDVVPGTTYYYKVCSYSTLSGSKVRSEMVGPVSIKAPGGSDSIVNKPTGLSAKMSAVAPGEVWINWNSVAGVDGYKVYRKAGANGTYSLLKDLKNPTGTSVWDANAVPGTTYYYQVCAYATIAGVTKTSEMTEPVSVKVPGTTTGSVSRVTGVTARSISYSSTKLTWNKVSNADGYYIYRKSGVNGSKYSAIKKLSKNSTISFVDRNLTTGNVYYYRIVAYKNSGSSVVKAASSATVKAKPVVAAVTGLSAVSRAKRVKLTWKRSSGASGYYVQKASSRYGTYQTIKMLKNVGTFTDYAMVYAEWYYYRILPYRVVAGKKVFGTPSNVVSGGYNWY